MSTTAVSSTSTGRYERRVARSRSTGIHIGRIGIGTVGFLTVLISAWGGIIPYVGPAFGYSADGRSSWDWTRSHTVLALVPGAIGVVVGLLILGETRGLMVGRGRVSLTMAGFVAVICGSWFVIGPFAWPVISTSRTYFAGAASPLRELANLAGYSLGTGVILAGFGAYAIGWATRHQPMANTTVREVVQETTPVAVAVPVQPLASVAVPVQSEVPMHSGVPVQQAAPVIPMPFQEGMPVQQVTPLPSMPIHEDMPVYEETPAAAPVYEAVPVAVPIDDMPVAVPVDEAMPGSNPIYPDAVENE
jgi:hypothetical protein